jgi:hypothetical protein
MTRPATLQDLLTRVADTPMPIDIDAVVESDYIGLALAGGVRRADLVLFTDVFDAHVNIVASPPLQEHARALLRFLGDYPMGGVNPADLLVTDAVAWVIATLPDVPADLPATWAPYTPHGWLFHAAGVDPDEAAHMESGSEKGLRALAALRDVVVPNLPSRVDLVWPRVHATC